MSINSFKDDLKFIGIDCLKDNRKNILGVFNAFVKISAVEKAPTLDFSLREYYFEEREDAKKNLLTIKQTGTMPE